MKRQSSKPEIFAGSLIVPGWHDEGRHAVPDPLADLLLGVAAILILIAIVILGAGHASLRTGTRDPVSKTVADAPSALSGEPGPGEFKLAPLLATRLGLRFGRDAADIAALDRILDDSALSSRLADIETSGASVLLLIEPDGLESAFVFDAAARHVAAGKMLQIRLDRPCGEITAGRLKALCRFEAAHAAK